jgi:hypothetical protein
VGGDEGGQSQECDEDLHFGLTWRLHGCRSALLGLTLENVFAGPCWKTTELNLGADAYNVVPGRY